MRLRIVNADCTEYELWATSLPSAYGTTELGKRAQLFETGRLSVWHTYADHLVCHSFALIDCFGRKGMFINLDRVT